LVPYSYAPVKQLSYHIYRHDDLWVYHEFYFWYLGAGGDDYRYFPTREEAEMYAKGRGGIDAYGY
jgi:hypothetical protein